MKTIDDIKAAARAAGNHFFETDTLSFFSSRISGAVFGGEYFVTSEQDKTGNAWNGARRYTVRRAWHGPNGFTVDTVGEFGEFATLDEAKSAAEKLAG
jgi:hypothetical protein